MAAMGWAAKRVANTAAGRGKDDAKTKAAWPTVSGRPGRPVSSGHSKVMAKTR